MDFSATSTLIPHPSLHVALSPIPSISLSQAPALLWRADGSADPVVQGAVSFSETSDPQKAQGLTKYWKLFKWEASMEGPNDVAHHLGPGMFSYLYSFFYYRYMAWVQYRSPQWPTQANASPRKPMTATQANNSHWQPTQANAGQRRPTRAHRISRDGPRYGSICFIYSLTTTMTNAGQWRPMQAHASPQQPHRPTTAIDSQWRPTQAHKSQCSKAAAGGARDATRLEPQVCSF